MTEQLQPTNLELYSRVIGAYEKADSNLRLIGIQFFIPIYVVFIPVAVLYFFEIGSKIIMQSLFVVFTVVIIISYLLYMRHFGRRFKDDVFRVKHRGLGGSFGRQFYRYILFRKELIESKVTPKDVKPIIALLKIEPNTFGSYISQRPFIVWLYTTTGGILATSATNWPFERVVGWVILAVGALFTHYVILISSSSQKGQYDLHRFLAWYEAEAPEPTTVPPDGANPLPD